MFVCEIWYLLLLWHLYGTNTLNLIWYSIQWMQPVNIASILTLWGRVTHICVGNLSIFGSDNGLSPGRRQAIIWTNTIILSIGTLATNFNEISIGIQTFSFKKMHFKMSSAKWRPFCLGLNELSCSSSFSTVIRDIRYLLSPNDASTFKDESCDSIIAVLWGWWFLMAWRTRQHYICSHQDDTFERAHGRKAVGTGKMTLPHYYFTWWTPQVKLCPYNEICRVDVDIWGKLWLTTPHHC